MKRISSLTGQRFGRWTVQDHYIDDGKYRRKWLCRCDCGTERYVLDYSLIHKSSQSCGCMARVNSAKTTSHELTGMTFGELTVLEKAAERTNSSLIQWHCRCSCGGEYTVDGTRLVNGRATHCPNRKAHRDLRKHKSTGV